VTTGLWRDDKHNYFTAYPGEPPQTYSVSITGALKSLDKPAIAIWAKSETAKAAVRNLDILARMVDEAGPESAISFLMKPSDKKMKKAGDRGTDIHSMIENYYLTDRAMPGSVADELAPYWEAFVRYDQDWKPQVIAVEYMVASPTYGYAGTGDLVVLQWCPFDQKYDRWRLDAKTMGVYEDGHKNAGQRKGPYAETALQLAAAHYADFVGRPNDPKKYTVPRADHCGVLALDEAGRYAVVPYTVTPETFVAFRAALTAKRWLDSEAKTAIGQPLALPVLQEAA
jgi:hypothetical protein